MINRRYFISLSVNGHSRHRFLYKKSWFSRPEFVIEYELRDYAKLLDLDPNTIKVNAFNRI
mgnify:CR=1